VVRTAFRHTGLRKCAADGRQVPAVPARYAAVPMHRYPDGKGEKMAEQDVVACAPQPRRSVSPRLLYA